MPRSHKVPLQRLTAICSLHKCMRRDEEQGSRCRRPLATATREGGPIECAPYEIEEARMQASTAVERPEMTWLATCAQGSTYSVHDCSLLIRMYTH